MQSRINALPIAEREEAIAQLEAELKAGTFNVLSPFRKTAYQRARDQYFAGLNASVTGGIVGGMAVFLSAAILPAIAVSATVLIGGGMLATKRWRDAQQAIKDDDFGYLLEDPELDELADLVGDMAKPKTQAAKLALERAREMLEEELGEAVDVTFVELPAYEEQSEYTVPNPWGNETNSATELAPPRQQDLDDENWEHQGRECAAAGITMREYRRVIECWPLDMVAPSPAAVAALIRAQAPVSTSVSAVSAPSFSDVSMPVFSDVSIEAETFQGDFETVSESVSVKDAAEVEALILEFAPHELSVDNPDTVFAVKEALRIGKSERWIRTELFEGVAAGGSKRYELFKLIVERALSWAIK